MSKLNSPYSIPKKSALRKASEMLFLPTLILGAGVWYGTYQQLDMNYQINDCLKNKQSSCTVQLTNAFGLNFWIKNNLNQSGYSTQNSDCRHKWEPYGRGNYSAICTGTKPSNSDTK